MANCAGNIATTSDLVVPRAAVKGRDHLNNVEVVDVALSDFEQGLWTVEVAGFRLNRGPQTFSLVGEKFVPTLFFWNSSTFCHRHFWFCRRPSLIWLCQRHPQLCRMFMPVGSPHEGLRIPLTRMEQFVAFSLRQLCDAAGAGVAHCSDHRIVLKHVPRNVEVRLVSDLGTRRQTLTASSGRHLVPVGNADLETTMVLFTLDEFSPGEPVQVDVPIKVSLE